MTLVADSSLDAVKLSLPGGVAGMYVAGIMVSDWLVILAVIAAVLTVVEKLIKVRSLYVSKRAAPQGTAQRPGD